MANNLSAAVADAILNQLCGNAPFVVNAPLQLALSVTMPDTFTPVEEPVGRSYARQEISFASAVDASVTNDAVISFADLPEGNIAGFGIYDSSDQLIWQGPAMVTRELAAGDDYEVPAGSLVVSLG